MGVCPSLKTQIRFGIKYTVTEMVDPITAPGAQACIHVTQLLYLNRKRKR
jgi:hypothetical protein